MGREAPSLPSSSNPPSTAFQSRRRVYIQHFDGTNPLPSLFHEKCLMLYFNSLQQPRSPCFSCDLLGFFQHLSNSSFRTTSLVTNHSAYSRKVDVIRGHITALSSQSEGGPVQRLDSLPVSVLLESISSESQFDRVIAEAKQLEESVDGKLVQEMYIFEAKVGKTGSRLSSKLQDELCFYIRCLTISENAYHTVERWREIGRGDKGHKAYLVINEVHEMI